jgi:Fe-S cluster assembly scaffold protein SufB
METAIEIKEQQNQSSTLTLKAHEKYDHPIVLGNESEVVIKEGSEVILINLHHTVNERNFHIHRGAQVKIFSFFINTPLTHKQTVHLKGECAQVHSYALFLGKDTQHITLEDTCVHHASSTHSKITVRGILKERAQAKFTGLVNIKEHATGCSGFQEEKALLLGEKARATLIPNLEIKNNDVQCSHGATVGRIDEEQVFYLESRGIPPALAMKMLTEGFFEEIIREIPETFQRQIRGLVQDA